MKSFNIFLFFVVCSTSLIRTCKSKATVMPPDDNSDEENDAKSIFSRLEESVSSTETEKNIYANPKPYQKNRNKTIEELSYIYEDERNSMISVTDADYTGNYIDFYEEMDNTVVTDNSMNVIYFGPSSEFARLDAETVLHIFQYTKKKKVPVSRSILAWDIITDGRTAAYLQGREYLAFDKLLNVIPEEDLYYVNIGNPTVANYFCNYKVDLDERKAGIIVSSFRRYYGNSWYRKGSSINQIGYLICSFTLFDIKQIDPKTFWELTIETMSKMSSCSLSHTKALYNIATQPTAFGSPYSWGSLEITRLGGLFIRIPKKQISLLHLEAVTGITPEVISMIDQSKLRYFSRQQILRMHHETRRKFILRVQLLQEHDMNFIFHN